MRHLRSQAALALVTLCLLAGCAIDRTVSPNGSLASPPTTLITDSVVLAQRLKPAGTLVSMTRLAQPQPLGSLRATKQSGPSLTLAATVAAPTVDGVQLEATDVIVSDSYAFITYGKRGETTKGAIDLVDISKPSSPRLVAEIALSDADAQTAVFSSATGTLYVGEGTSDPNFSNRGVVHVFPLGSTDPKKFSLNLANAKRYAVPSYLATGLALVGTDLYVTSGTGGSGTGGVTAFDANMQKRWTDTFLDARAIAIAVPGANGTGGQDNGGGNNNTDPGKHKGEDGHDDSNIPSSSARLCVVAGHTLRIYDAGAQTPSRSVTFDGNATPEARSTVSYDGATDDCIIAAEDGGVVVVNAASGKVLATASLPLSGTDAQANSATLWDGLLYVAGGSNGVVVMDPYSDGADKNPVFGTIGSLVFPGSSSANAIYASGVSDVILVADGLGGTRIVTR